MGKGPVPVYVDGICGVGDGVGQGHPKELSCGEHCGAGWVCAQHGQGTGGTNGAGGRAWKKALFGIGFPSAGNVKFQVPI